MKYFLLLIGSLYCMSVQAQDGEQALEDQTVIETEALSLAQSQLDAYNQRDIEGFLEPYAEDVKLYRYPGTVFAEGKDAMRRMYTSMFERTPELKCILLGRMVMGNTVIDREKVYLGDGRYMHAIAIYKIREGKIAEVRFIQN